MSDKLETVKGRFRSAKERLKEIASASKAFYRKEAFIEYMKISQEIQGHEYFFINQQGIHRMNDLIEEAEKHALEILKTRHAKSSDMIYALVERLKLQSVEINELKKKRTKGEINEAYAKTIEVNKDEISKLKVKVNKLQQSVSKLNNLDNASKVEGNE